MDGKKMSLLEGLKELNRPGLGGAKTGWMRDAGNWGGGRRASGVTGQVESLVESGPRV